jgi:hypothetical protein
MGLKSGSRDAGLDEDEEDAATDPDESRATPAETTETTPESDDAGAGAGGGDTAGDDATTGGEVSESPGESGGVDPVASSGDRPSMESIPYVLRRSKVNEGRDQVPFFLREPVVEGGTELQERLEAMLGEEVYKSDYREAAMVVAQRRPELVAEVLREWGYDLD